MDKENRRKIHELITRYEMEPELKDIYVEGNEDIKVLNAFFEEKDISDVCIFEISSVDIPCNLYVENNNRTRLITLAKELHEKLSSYYNNVKCIIDSDFDYITGQSYDYLTLLTTDYANMEMYFFTNDNLLKLSSKCLTKNKNITLDCIEHFIVPTLIKLFKIRFVNETDKWKLTEYPFKSLVNFNGDTFSLDIDEYMKKYLNKNDRFHEFRDFQLEVNSVSLKDEFDKRCYIHGHDFLNLLKIMLNALSRKLYNDEEEVFNLLKMGYNFADLENEDLFKNLLICYK